MNEPFRGAVPRPIHELFPEAEDINFVRGVLKDRIEAGEINVPGRLEGKDATATVNRVVGFYLELIGELAASSDPQLLIAILMAQLETNLIETNHLEAPPDAVRSSAIIGHRFLIERFVAEPPPGGGDEPTPTLVRRLIAAASELLNFGVFSDVLHTEALDGAIWIDEEGYFCSIMSEEAEATQLRFVARMIGSSGRFRDQLAAQERVPPDVAIEAEFGVTWIELFALFNALRDFPDENMGAYFADYAWFVETLGVATGVDRERVEQWVEAISLSPRANYLEVSAPFGMNDVMPWRFNRRLSYFRRPLVLVRGGDGLHVGWSLEHLRAASARIAIDILHGSFRGVSEALEAWLRAVRSENAERFNDEIADMVTGTLDRVIVRRRIDTFAGVRMERPNGEAIGDIDVLLADPVERLLVLTETKDFRANLVLSTLRDELGAFEEALGHVRERTAWVRGHLPEVAAELGLVPGEIEQWSIHPRVVTDEPVAAAAVRDWGIEIITFDDLLALVNDGAIA